MKKQILLSCALAWAVMAGAETIDITTFRYAGPYVVLITVFIHSQCLG